MDSMSPDGVAEYYKSYESIRSGNVELSELLRDKFNLFRETLHREFAGKPVRALVLGSATPRNMRTLQFFLTRQLEVAAEGSSISLLDVNETTLANHREYATGTDRLPPVRVVEGDVRKYPFDDKFELIFSDYTTSFLLDEQSWRDFFKEIGRSLTDDGHAIAHCFVVREKNIPPVLVTDEDETKRGGVSAEALKNMLTDAHLVTEAEHYRPAKRVYSGHASEIATLMLRAEKPELV